jgi:hypothetical protein
MASLGLETLMSRGPGRIERAIAAVLDAEPDNAVTTDDLCDRVYRGVNRIEKKHRVAVLRAARNLMKRRDTMACSESDTLGGMMVFYNKDNVMSYAMSRLKGDGLNHYRSNDDRWFRPERKPKWFRRAMGYEKGYVYQNHRSTEAELRAKLAEDRYQKYVVPGGAWWRHTQEAMAELEAIRAGDTARLEQLRAEAKEASEAALAEIAAGIGADLKGTTPTCSFCGKTRDQVTTLFLRSAGDNSGICNECVARCSAMSNQSV